MTISSANFKDRYTGDGVSTTFTVNTQFQNATELLVTVLATNGTTESVKVKDSDYTVLGGNGAGGSITFLPGKIPVIGEKITITRNMPYTQLTDLVQNDPLPANTVELSFGDRLIMIVQQLAEKTNRCLTLFVSTALTNPPQLSDPVDGKTIVYNQASNTFVPGPTATDIANAQTYANSAAASAAAAATFNPALYLAKSDNLGSVGSVPLARANLQAAQSGSNSDILSINYLQSVNGGKRAGFVNYLINGSFLIWQRGTSFALSASYQYICDRWKAVATSAWTARQEAYTIDSQKYGLQLQRTAGSSDTTTVAIMQVTESVNIPPLRGLNMTLSGKFKLGNNFSAPSLNFGVYWATGIDQSSVLANGFASVAVNTAGLIPNGWYNFVAYSAVGSGVLPATANQLGVLITFAGTGTAGTVDAVSFKELQLEVGSSQSVFEDRSYDVEIELCKRFYQKSFRPPIAPASAVGVNSGEVKVTATNAGAAAFRPFVRFIKAMRAAPTITIFNPAATGGGIGDQCRNEVTNTNCTGTSATSVSEHDFAVPTTQPSGTSVGDYICFHYTADAEL